MTRLLAILGLLVAASADAAVVLVSWDDQPITVTNYTVHVAPAGGEATLFMQTGTNRQQIVTLSGGSWDIWVTALSVDGLRSDNSNVVLRSVPVAPVIRVNLQGAAAVDGPWENIASISAPLETTNRMAFYRGQLEIVR